jgi:hypothetical protein
MLQVCSDLKIKCVEAASVNLKCVEAGLCDILNSSSSVHFKFIGPADRKN